MFSLFDTIGQPTNIWGMINRLPSLFGQQEPPKRIDQPLDKSGMYPPPKKSQAPQKRDFSFAKDFIQQPGIEGRRNKYYWDKKAFRGEGAITSGVGHLHPETRGREIYKRKLEGIRLKEKDVEETFLEDLDIHGNRARNFLGKNEFDRLPENIQVALTSWSFNPGDMSEWTDLRDAVQNYTGDTMPIISALLDSERATQIGERTGHEINKINEVYRQEPQIPPPQPQMQPQMLVADKSGMYPPPKRQMQPQAQMQAQMQPSLQQVAQTAQAQPALNPFPWLKEMSGSYSYSPPVGKWV